MRLGLFGGSFDPVHRGHLSVARACLQQARLEEIWFIPAAQAPHKSALAGGHERAEMLELATADEPRFCVSRMELERGGVSYTVETLRAISASQPAAELFLILGADMLADLPHWAQPGEICRLAIPLCVARPGEPALNLETLSSLVTPERLAIISQWPIQLEPIDVSSTQVRERLAAGDSVGDLLPRGVEAYIRQRGLYGSQPQD